MPDKSPKGVVILGATGSIGQSALRVLRQNRERLRLVGIAADRNAEALAAIACEFDVPRAVLADETSESDTFPAQCHVATGPEALCDLVRGDEVDIVLVAIVGTAGLAPTLAAIRAGKDLALASKEVLVVAGEFVMPEVARWGVRLIPTDSEHNAIFQCLEGVRREHLDRVILTASGGPFRDWDADRIAAATPDEALQHPTWAMGRKITVDSATMANKGLEMIEARWLFDLAPDQIEVVVHPQSVVHSMIVLRDGSTLAQLGPPSMTFPIQHALLYPERGMPPNGALDWARAHDLSFMPPDERRFPCLRLARDAMIRGGAAPCVFNAANEVAVAAFLEQSVPLNHIPQTIEQALERLGGEPIADLSELLAVDQETRSFSVSLLNPT